MKKGFTLAEVLITLGIIGVVAALTIPTLIANYQKKVTINKLKKSYSLLEQAFKMAEVENGSVLNWNDWDNSETILTKYIAPQLQGTKVYPTNAAWDKLMCYEEGAKNPVVYPDYSQYNWLSGVPIATPFMHNNMSSIRLNNGACIGLNNNNIREWSLHIFVDINGSYNGPNMAGKDLFFFYINDNGFIKPYGDTWSDELLDNDPKSQNSCNPKSSCGGFVCAAKIMRENWEINY